MPLAGIYGSQSREDYSEDDVEHYFNYMGMLATEVRRHCNLFLCTIQNETALL